MRYRELVRFTRKNISSSSIYLNVSTICGSQYVQTVFDFMPCVFQQMECHISNCTADSCMALNHTTKFWMEYIALPPKFQWGYTVGLLMLYPLLSLTSNEGTR